MLDPNYYSSLKNDYFENSIIVNNEYKDNVINKFILTSWRSLVARNIGTFARSIRFYQDWMRTSGSGYVGIRRQRRTFALTLKSSGAVRKLSASTDLHFAAIARLPDIANTIHFIRTDDTKVIRWPCKRGEKNETDQSFYSSITRKKKTLLCLKKYCRNSKKNLQWFSELSGTYPESYIYRYKFMAQWNHLESTSGHMRSPQVDNSF